MLIPSHRLVQRVFYMVTKIASEFVYNTINRMKRSNIQTESNTYEKACYLISLGQSIVA